MQHNGSERDPKDLGKAVKPGRADKNEQKMIEKAAVEWPLTSAPIETPRKPCKMAGKGHE